MIANRKECVDPQPAIGAIVGSAEAPEALNNFFQQLPSETGLPLLLLQCGKLTPKFIEQLKEHTSLPIHELVDATTLKPDHVYVLPIGRKLHIMEGQIGSSNFDNDSPAPSLDDQLQTLAQDSGQNILAIILAGTGSDGSIGVKAVNQAGSLVFLERPDFGAWNSRPQNAIDELDNTKGDLKGSKEQLSAGNEKRQSFDEEPQPSHQQRLSINEELQSSDLKPSKKILQVDTGNSDLENYFKSSQIAALFLDKDSRIKRFTPEVKNVFSVIESDVGRRITDLATGFKNLQTTETLEEVVKSLKMHEGIIQKDYSHRWFKIHIHPYQTTKSDVEGTVITFYEITEQVFIEKELSSRLAQQTAAANLGLKALDPETTTDTLFNEVAEQVANILGTEYCKILKYQTEQQNLLLVAGKGWNKAKLGSTTVPLGKKSQAGFTMSINAPIVVEDYKHESRFSKSELLNEHDSISGVSVTIKGPDDRAYGVLGVHSKNRRHFTENDIQFLQTVANILSTRLEKQELEEDRSRYRKIIHSSQDVVISEDLHGNVTSWNPTAQELFGFSEKEALGKKLFQLIPLPHRHQKRILQAHALIKKEESVPSFAIEWQRENGETVHLLINLSSIKHQGSICGISWIGRDITSRKRFERALIEARDSAHQNSEFKSRFMGVLSHELRTPLSSVIGYTHLCLESEELPPLVRKNLSRVVANSELIQTLVDDILDLSRIEKGKVKIEETWIEPKVIFQQLINIYGVGMNSKDIEIKLEFEENFPEKLKVDSLRLQQIVGNVLSNAVKYTNEGVITIHCRIDNDKGSQPLLEVVVSDTGKGIPADKQEKLFEPFYRVESSQGAPGVGLGLYLAQNLARVLNGDIRLLESTQGVGSSFLISLKIETINGQGKQPKVQCTGQTVKAKAPLTGLKILLADDSTDLRNLFGIFLKKSGAQVVLASDGGEALKAGTAQGFDIVILDLSMPVMGGKDVMINLREGGIGIPIVALSAHAMKDVEKDCLESGFNDYIPKPVTKTTLIEKVLLNLQK